MCVGGGMCVCGGVAMSALRNTVMSIFVASSLVTECVLWSPRIVIGCVCVCLGMVSCPGVASSWWLGWFHLHLFYWKEASRSLRPKYVYMCVYVRVCLCVYFNVHSFFLFFLFFGRSLLFLCILLSCLSSFIGFVWSCDSHVMHTLLIAAVMWLSCDILLWPGVAMQSSHDVCLAVQLVSELINITKFEHTNVSHTTHKMKCLHQKYLCCSVLKPHPQSVAVVL